MADVIATKYVIDGDSSGAVKAFRDLANVNDKFQEGVKNSGDKITAFAEKNRATFTSMAAGGAVAFGAISAFIMKSVKDYGEAETAQLQLEHAVRDVSKATLEQLQATSDLADEIQRKGVLDGDNVKIGLAQLSTFGLSNEAVRGLGQSMADLAVNQFGVTASGDQLTASANMIQKAMRGEFGMLEKSGIRFSEAQKHAIEFGTEMEKVAAINEGFAQNLKYTNEVALQGFEGQAAKMAVQMGDLSETFGSILKPALEGLMIQLSPIITGFTDWVANNPELVKNIVFLAGGIAGLVGVVGTLGLLLPTIVAAFTFLVSPIGLVIAAVTLLATAWATNFLGIRDITAQVWDWIKEKTAVFVAGLMEIWEALTAFWKEHGEGIKLYFTTWFEILSTIFRVGWDIIVGTVKVVWEYLKTYIAVAWELIKGIIVTGLQILSGDWSGAWETIKNTFFTVLNLIQTGGQNILNIIKETFLGVWTDIKTGISNIMEGIYTFVIAKLEAIQKTLKKVRDAAAEIATLGFAKTETFNGSDNPPRASGGPVVAGRRYTINEDGQESFVPAVGGRIMNASDTAKMSGGQNVTIQINNPTVREDQDIYAIAQAVEDVLTKRAKNFTLGIA